jgi:hypothetical protein
MSPFLHTRWTAQKTALPTIFLIVLCVLIAAVTLLWSRCLRTLSEILPTYCLAAKDIEIHRLMGGVYEVRRLDGPRCNPYQVS